MSIKHLSNPGAAGTAVAAVATDVDTLLLSTYDMQRSRRKGNTYFVIGGESGTIGSNTNDGKSWSTAWATLTYALTQVAAHDTIYVSAGSVSATVLEDSLTITQNGLRIIGAMSSQHTWGWPSIHTHDADNIMTINAVGVEIANLGFHHQGANATIVLGNTAAAWRNHIHHCFFGGNGTATYAIDIGSLNDAPFTVVDNCEFQHYATAGIRLDAFSSTIKDNVFVVSNSTTGLVQTSTGANRPYSKIMGNTFIAEGTAAKGIDVSNTPTAGLLTIAGNKFNNFSTMALACTVCGTTKTGILGAGNQYNDEDLMMYPRRVSKAKTSHLTSGTLFTFKGTVGIVSITGRLTTGAEAAANTCKLSVVSDALAAYDICATKDLTGLDAGTLLSITGTAADALVATDAVGAMAPGQAGMVVATCITSGTITDTYSDTGNRDGAITWEILWIPLSQGASLY